MIRKLIENKLVWLNDSQIYEMIWRKSLSIQYTHCTYSCPCCYIPSAIASHHFLHFLYLLFTCLRLGKANWKISFLVVEPLRGGRVEFNPPPSPHEPQSISTTPSPPHASQSSFSQLSCSKASLEQLLAGPLRLFGLQTRSFRDSSNKARRAAQASYALHRKPSKTKVK